MRDLFSIAGVSLLRTWKEKTFLVIMVATALVFTSISGLIFGGFGSGTALVPVGVTDNDGSSLSRRMVDDLKGAGLYAVRMEAETKLYQDVRQGNIETGFVIPQEFEASVKSGSPLKVVVVSLSTSKTGMVTSKVMEKSVTSYILDQAVRSVGEAKAAELGLSGKVDVAAAARTAGEQLSKSPVMEVQFQEVQQDAAKVDAPTWSAGFSSGIYIMFTMFTVISLAGDILKERRLGTWGRLLSTPVSRSSILGGKMLGTFAVGLTQMFILVVFGRYVFKINFGSNLWGVFLILALMTAVVTSLGLFLSTLVRTTAQLQAFAPIVIVSTSMLGGCYWPLEVVSPVMQTLAKATPQAWAMTALTDVALRGRSLASTAGNLGVLACFGVAFFVLGAARVKYE